MGLFSSIASIFSGAGNKKAAQKAADAQVAAAQLGVDEERRQYDQTRTDNLPFLTAGVTALGKQGDLLGLNGADTQSSAIDSLKASPLYQSLFGNGEETILQNASATGGLRGGNATRSLADFGRDTLAQVIQQQVANFGGIAGQGQQTGATLGTLGANAANQIAQLFTQQGQARAGGILGAQAGRNQMIAGFGSIGDKLASAIPGNPLGKIFG